MVLLLAILLLLIALSAKFQSEWELSHTKPMQSHQALIVTLEYWITTLAVTLFLFSDWSAIIIVASQEKL